MTDVTLYLKRNKQKGVPQKRRGPLLNPGRDELLPGPRAGTVTLNFVDMGQRWDGSSYVDITFKVEPTITGSGFGTPSLPDFSATDWDSLRSTIYAYIAADGLDNFRPLGYTDAEEYGLDFYYGANFSTFDSTKYLPVARVGSRKWVKDQSTAITSNPAWTASGLKIPKGTNTFQLWSHTAFISPKSLSTQFKITSGDAYSDPPVSFSFSANCTIFLMPRVVSEFGGAQIGVGIHVVILNLFYVLQPRAYWLGRDFDWTSFSSFGVGTGFEYSTLKNVFSNPTEAGYADTLLAFMKARPTARVFNTQTQAYDVLSAFPQVSNHWKGGYTASGVNPGTSEMVAGIVPVPAGTLVAIIRRGTSLFYVWHDSTTFVSGGPILANAGGW